MGSRQASSFSKRSPFSWKHGHHSISSTTFSINVPPGKSQRRKYRLTVAMYKCIDTCVHEKRDPRRCTFMVHGSHPADVAGGHRITFIEAGPLHSTELSGLRGR
jgi:hypothetical protein